VTRTNSVVQGKKKKKLHTAINGGRQDDIASVQAFAAISSCQLNVIFLPKERRAEERRDVADTRDEKVRDAPQFWVLLKELLLQLPLKGRPFRLKCDENIYYLHN
jgi:hypothetical protein